LFLSLGVIVWPGIQCLRGLWRKWSRNFTKAKEAHRAPPSLFN
jgi:hypothetical protein